MFAGDQVEEAVGQDGQDKTKLRTEGGTGRQAVLGGLGVVSTHGAGQRVEGRGHAIDGEGLGIVEGSGRLKREDVVETAEPCLPKQFREPRSPGAQGPSRHELSCKKALLYRLGVRNSAVYLPTFLT